MKIFYIDLFSGAGGTTTGIRLVGNAVVPIVAREIARASAAALIQEFNQVTA